MSETCCCGSLGGTTSVKKALHREAILDQKISEDTGYQCRRCFVCFGQNKTEHIETVICVRTLKANTYLALLSEQARQAETMRKAPRRGNLKFILSMGVD